MTSSIRRLFIHLSLISCFIIGSLFSFRSFLIHPTTAITDPADAVLTVWIIRRVQDNFIAGRSLFDSNLFYPHQNSILFSDTFITTAILSLPLRLVTSEPIPFFSLSMMVSLALMAIATYLLLLRALDHVKDFRMQVVLAFTGAIIFAWSPAHFHYSVHLQMFALQYVIFAYWALISFWRTGRGKWLIVATLFTLLQLWQSIFLAYAVFLAIPFLFRSSKFREHLKTNRWFALTSIGLLVVLTAPLAYGYIHFYQTYHVTRDIREVINFSMILGDIFGKFFSPVIYLLTCVALFIKQGKKKPNWFFLALTIFFFILSFGPALHITPETLKFTLAGHVLHIPLPYLLFYYLVPGFQAFRTPSRFFPLALLALTVWSIRRLSYSKLHRQRVVGICMCLIGFTLITLPRLPVLYEPSVSGYPPSVAYLRDRPETVVLYLPMRDWAEPNLVEGYPPMLYSLIDKKTLVNGQSGFYPPEWVDFLKTTRTFPSETSLQAIKARGVELLVLDKRYITLSASIATEIYQDKDVIILKL